MLVGLLFISTLVAALGSALSVSLGMPLWLGILTFPMIGTSTLLLSSLLVYTLRHSDPDRDHEHGELTQDHPATA